MKISRFFAYLYFIGSVCYSIYLFNTNDSGQGLLLLSYLGLLFIPLIIKKIFKLNFDEVILSLYYLFLILASLLGVFMKFYNTIFWFDDLVHFLSGILSSYLALIILRKFNIKNKTFMVIFIISFALGVASIWEFFEYTVDLITHKDLQKVALYGVNDTMQDMLMAFAASIIFNVGLLFKKRSKDK